MLPFSDVRPRFIFLQTGNMSLPMGVFVRDFSTAVQVQTKISTKKPHSCVLVNIVFAFFPFFFLFVVTSCFVLFLFDFLMTKAVRVLTFLY